MSNKRWGRRRKDKQAYIKSPITTRMTKDGVEWKEPPTARKKTFQKGINHQEILLDFKKYNIKNCTLVNIDTHSDLIRDESISSREVTSETAKDPDMQAMWIRLAMEKGYVDNLVWVVPDPLVEDYGGIGEFAWELDKITGVTDKSVSGVIDGKRVLITTLDNLSVTKGPVVLSVDSDYLGEGDQQWSQDYEESWIDPISLTREIKRRIPEPTHVFVCESPSYLNWHLKDDAAVLEKEMEKQYG